VKGGLHRYDLFSLGAPIPLQASRGKLRQPYPVPLLLSGAIPT